MEYEDRIDNLYATLDDPTAFGDALHILQEPLNASALHVLVVNPVTGLPVTGLCPATPEGHDTYVTQYAAIDPRERYFGNNSFEAFNLNSIFESPQYSDSRVYHDFLKEFDAQIGASVIKKINRTTTLVFSSFRPASLTYFDQTELHRIEAIARNLARITTFKSIHGHDIGNNAAHGTAVFINAAKRVLEITPEAERELNKPNTALKLSFERLWATERQSNRKLQDAIDVAISGKEKMPDDVVIRDMSGNPEYIVSVQAVFGSAMLDMLMMTPRLIVRFRNIGKSLIISETILCDLFGLTPTEAVVTRLMCYGVSPQDIAHQRGVAISTIRWTIKNLLEKFEVSSQSALVSRVARVPGLLK